MNAGLEISPAQAAELVRHGAQLVDVREPHEHDAGRIAGDLHIPLDELPARAGALDRERPVIFYCRTGARSGLATQAFRGAGYDARNLAGGIVAWVDGRLPIEPEDGHVAAH